MQERSMLGQITRGAIGAMIAALSGLAAVVVVGFLAFGAVRGFNGALIAGVVGALVGGLIRGFGDCPVRSLAGAVGGAVGGYFAVAAAEQFAPGSWEWAVYGGPYAALFGVSVAVVLAVTAGSVVGLFRRRA